MAKFYYACVHQVDMAFMAPWGKGGNHAEDQSDDSPLLVRHWIRINPSKNKHPRRDGRPAPPDFIVTDKPLAKHFTEQMIKKVSRPAFDPYTGKILPQRAYRKKITKIKFELVPQDELLQYIAEGAIKKPWAPEMFEETSARVELPKDPELEKQLALLGPDEEPEVTDDMVKPEGQLVRAGAGRPRKANQ